MGDKARQNGGPMGWSGTKRQEKAKKHIWGRAGSLGKAEEREVRSVCLIRVPEAHTGGEGKRG